MACDNKPTASSGSGGSGSGGSNGGIAGTGGGSGSPVAGTATFDSEIRVGDEFDVRVRVTGQLFSMGYWPVASVVDPHDTAYFLPATLLASKRVERPLAVGDRTQYGRIIAIDGAEAWIDTGRDRSHVTCDLAALRRA